MHFQILLTISSHQPVHVTNLIQFARQYWPLCHDHEQVVGNCTCTQLVSTIQGHAAWTTDLITPSFGVLDGVLKPCSTSPKACHGSRRSAIDQQNLSVKLHGHQYQELATALVLITQGTVLERVLYPDFSRIVWKKSLRLFP